MTTAKAAPKHSPKNWKNSKPKPSTRFDRVQTLFEKVRKAFDKEGYGSPSYIEDSKVHQRRVDDGAFHRSHH
jgi:RNA polymerase primary sigma factor